MVLHFKVDYTLPLHLHPMIQKNSNSILIKTFDYALPTHKSGCLKQHSNLSVFGISHDISHHIVTLPSPIEAIQFYKAYSHLLKHIIFPMLSKLYTVEFLPLSILLSMNLTSSLQLGTEVCVTNYI